MQYRRRCKMSVESHEESQDYELFFNSPYVLQWKRWDKTSQLASKEGPTLDIEHWDVSSGIFATLHKYPTAHKALWQIQERKKKPLQRLLKTTAPVETLEAMKAFWKSIYAYSFCKHFPRNLLLGKTNPFGLAILIPLQNRTFIA